MDSQQETGPPRADRSPAISIGLLASTIRVLAVGPCFALPLTTHLVEGGKRTRLLKRDILAPPRPPGVILDDALPELSCSELHSTTQIRNGFRQVLAAVDALLRTNTYEYCHCGLLNAITNPLNQGTTFSYDNSGRKTLTLYPDNFAEGYGFDLMNRLTNRWDSSGLSVTNWYNN